jgi:hypothetical protein
MEYKYWELSHCMIRKNILSNFKNDHNIASLERKKKY